MDSVGEANADEVSRLAPLIIFLLLIIVTGIPGNMVVCAVYRNKYKLSSSKFFIFALAVIDLIGCFIVSLEVANVAQQYTFTNMALCKATIFLELWPILTSAFLLLAISVDRYRKVCHTPGGWQITVKTGKVLLTMCVGAAFMFSWPALVLYGITPVDTHKANLTGTTCTILEDYKESVGSRIFNGLLMLLFVVALSLLTVLYSLICVKVMRHEKTLRAPSICSQKPDSSSELEYDRYKKTTTTPKKELAVSPSQQNFQRKTSVCARASVMTRKSTSGRLTLTMCIISIVFIVSFLPYTTLRILQVSQKDFVGSMSDIGRAFQKTFLRTYFLNCAVNPIVYYACSAQFRNDVKGYLRKMCSR